MIENLCYFLYCSFFDTYIQFFFFSIFFFFCCLLFVFCFVLFSQYRTTTKKCWSCFEYMFIFVNQEHISLFQENPKDIVYIDSVDLLGIDICWRIATEAPSELFLDCDSLIDCCVSTIQIYLYIYMFNILHIYETFFMDYSLFFLFSFFFSFFLFFFVLSVFFFFLF